MVYWFLSCFASATLQVVLEKLADSGIRACGSMSDADDKLRKLKRTLLRLQSEIAIEGERQISNMAWQALLQDLEEVAYDADDLLDEFAIEVAASEGRKHMLADMVSKFLLSLYKRTLAPNLTGIQSKLDGMLEEMKRIVEYQHLNMLGTKPHTTSLTDESLVFGREDDKRKIIDMLVASDGTSNVCIIPIVGMIGVGKTVLAKLVHNHDYEAEATMSHSFGLKMWVSVTRDFDIERLTRSIIEAAGGQTAHLSSLQTLHLELKRIIQGKKFLLVLDDLWNEERDNWEALLEPLKHGFKGSKILVTTRSNAVSSLVGTNMPYHLKCLSDDDCWVLLKRVAFGNANLQIDAVLEEIGMKIARKCKGFPLAAKSVGRVLHRRIEEDAWNFILQSKLWDLPAIQSEVVPGLRSTCDHLPSYLKPCFAYCSMFPQNHGFEKHKTIKMWIGEGFIPNKEGEVVEDKASYYFEQLFFTSFFHQLNNEKYKMQNVIHDLAQTVFGEKFSRVEEADASSINAKTRHLSLVCKTATPKNFDVSYRWKALRTFLIFSDSGAIIAEVPHALFFKLGRLRVLDLSSTKIKELATSIGNLRHLRFLDLSSTLLKCLPETVQELGVLQTLRLVDCRDLLYLPRCISKLICLRHLEISGDYQLTSMPPGIGKLTGLKTVSEFIVGSESGQINELKDMDNIQGSLCIKQLEKVKKPQEALEANLAKKVYLDELDLQWGSTVDALNDEHVLNNLMEGPPKSLKKLTLQGYGGRMFPKWVSDPECSKLTSIFFSKCKNCSLLPPLGQLPKLKILKIAEMYELVTVDETFLGDVPGFQSLESLEFRGMPNLNSWVGLRDNDMIHLRELTIDGCPQMVIVPSLHYLQSLQKLEFENCTQLSTLTDEVLSRSVESLIIEGCPMLTERCKRNGGEDWRKIEHIQKIEIDYEDPREL